MSNDRPIVKMRVSYKGKTMGEGYKDIIVNHFTEEAAAKFREEVIARSILDQQAPIIIYIDSYGGYIDSVNNMLATLEQIHNPVITVCVGKAMSCGSVLLAAGDHRFCDRHSRVLIHQGSSGAGGPIEGMQNDVDESKRLNKELMTFIAMRCGMSLRDFKTEMRSKLIKGDDEARDWYLPAQAALDLGIVDFIGMPLVKPMVSYHIEASLPKEYPPIAKKPIKKKKVKKKTSKKKKKKKK